MNEFQPWHQLFGLTWIDFFEGSDIAVEMEIDLSLKQQFLDLVIIRKGLGQIRRALPDGFEDLTAFNLVTFKSYREALDVWALLELVGHFVNYRKQSSPSMQELLPESDYRLFAVCARFPSGLAQQVQLTQLHAGVYAVSILTRLIRIIVVSQLPQEEQNAMLHLFSAREDLLRYGQEHYRPYSQDSSTLLNKLFKAYREDPDMNAKLEAFVRKARVEILNEMSLEERLEGLSPEQLMKGLTDEELLKRVPAEERLKGMPTEERLKGMPTEERLKGMPTEERLKGMPTEDRLKGLSNEELLKRVPTEELLKGIPAAERFKGLSTEELAQAFPPEVLESLVRQFKADKTSPNVP